MVVYFVYTCICIDVMSGEDIYQWPQAARGGIEQPRIGGLESSSHTQRERERKKATIASECTESIHMRSYI